jgi:hypothetical protein
MPLSPATQQAIAEYDESDKDELRSKLAIYVGAYADAPEALNSAQPAITSDMQTMGWKEDVQALAERLLKRWATELHRVVCGTSDADAKDRAEIRAAINSKNFTSVGAATAITTVLIASFGLNIAIAPVVAMLLVKIIIEPSKDVVCDFWEEKLKAWA